MTIPSPLIELFPLEIEIFISPPHGQDEEYPISLFMKDEMDNTIHMEAKELNLRFATSDIVKPSAYSMELFHRTGLFTKEQRYFLGGMIIVRSCEFGYITTILDETHPPREIVQATHKNLIIRLINNENS